MTGLLWRWGPVVGWLGVIWYMSSLSGSQEHVVTRGSLVFSTAGHAGEYGLLGALLGRALPQVRGVRWVAVWLVITLWGVTDEFHQSFVPERDVELYDVMVDSLAGGAGLIAWAVLRRWLPGVAARLS